MLLDQPAEDRGAERAAEMAVPLAPVEAGAADRAAALLQRGQIDPEIGEEGAALAGQSQVRIAFVFVNGNGNNIYLDNIEFFVSETPIVVANSMEVYPNPFLLSTQNQNPLSVTFSLPEKGPVLIEVIDMVGRVLINETPQNVLNQTYTISAPDLPVGIYIVRAKSSTGTFTGVVHSSR